MKEMINSTNKEAGENMGFMLAHEIAINVAEMALSMRESEEAVVIPDSEGQVLVRFGTEALKSRQGVQEIFKIPVKLKTIVNGEEQEQIFFVCTE